MTIIECVKCGASCHIEDGACAKCTWPRSVSAWSSSSLTIRRVTLDTCCINAKGRDPHLNQLERWARAGHLELQRSDEMLRELSGRSRVAKATAMSPHPKVFRFGRSGLDGPDVLSGPDLSAELRQILFPTSPSLTDNQVADIEHLRLHVSTGDDVFVTLNHNDFTTRGRQEILHRAGIWVFSPEGAVSLLSELYRWS